jgi:hypothetical protein
LPQKRGISPGGLRWKRFQPDRGLRCVQDAARRTQVTELWLRDLRCGVVRDARTKKRFEPADTCGSKRRTATARRPAWF